MHKEKSINRFITAQTNGGVWKAALKEIASGRKESHWIWFVFPQLKGLGSSSMCEYYGIRDMEEAKEYLLNRTLRMRLRMITAALLKHKGKPIEDILGSIDAMKMRSCATLFYRAANTELDRNLFKSVLDEFYGGEEDMRTLALLGYVAFSVNGRKI